MFLEIEKAQIILHEADKPYAVGLLSDTHRRARIHSAIGDLAVPYTDPTALCDLCSKNRPEVSGKPGEVQGGGYKWVKIRCRSRGVSGSILDANQQSLLHKLSFA